MSLKTWKREFYRKNARDVSATEAIAHSIKKWTGLYASVLKRHGIERDDSDIVDHVMEHVAITSESCALCVHYIGNDCANCPLFIVRGNVSCDRERVREKMSPYKRFSMEGNPRPMIIWLKKADAMAKAKKK